MKTLGISLVSWAGLVSCLVAQSSDFHTFTNTEGKSLEAKILRVMDDTMIIQAKNGRSYTVKKELFSDSDQSYIRKWAEEEAKNYVPSLDVDFSSGKGDAKDGTDYDNRSQRLSPKVSIKNRDARFTVKNANVTVLMFGKDVLNSRKLKVLSRQSYKLSSLEPGQTATWEGKSFTAPYDDNSAAQFGHKYNGYIVVVENESGKKIHTAGTASYKNYSEAAMRLKTGSNTTRAALGN